MRKYSNCIDKTLVNQIYSKKPTNYVAGKFFRVGRAFCWQDNEEIYHAYLFNPGIYGYCWLDEYIINNINGQMEKIDTSDAWDSCGYMWAFLKDKGIDDIDEIWCRRDYENNLAKGLKGSDLEEEQKEYLSK